MFRFLLLDTPVPATATPGSEGQNVLDSSHHERKGQMCSVKKSIDAQTVAPVKIAWKGARVMETMSGKGRNNLM